jgi:hypothetical protein
MKSAKSGYSKKKNIRINPDQSRYGSKHYSIELVVHASSSKSFSLYEENDFMIVESTNTL